METGSGAPELLINAQGPTLQGEAYKHLRTSILSSTPGRAPKTLLVTSSVPVRRENNYGGKHSHCVWPKQAQVFS